MIKNKKLLNIYKLFIVGLFIILFLSFIIPVKSETIIYDNFTTSNFKFITLDDNINNLPIVGDYKYKVILNGNFLGYYGKDEDIFYPENSNIIIYVPSPIKTSTDNVYDTSIRPILFTAVGFLITYGLTIIIIIAILGYIGYQLYRKIKRGY